MLQLLLADQALLLLDVQSLLLLAAVQAVLAGPAVQAVLAGPAAQAPLVDLLGPRELVAVELCSSSSISNSTAASECN